MLWLLLTGAARMSAPSPLLSIPMLDLRDIRKSYSIGKNRMEVLRGVDLAIAEGELACIMGASGSGKSTLMNVIGLMDAYDSGEYRFDGELMKGLTETQAAGHRSRRIGFVFQSFNLIAFKTAAENVALPLYYQGVGRRERNRRSRDLLDRVGLSAWADHRPSEMSGGQQQRVAIARALASRPRLILADEPTGALDSATSLEVINLLREIHRTGVTIIVVTHEHDIAALTDRVIRLKDGKIDADSRN